VNPDVAEVVIEPRFHERAGTRFDGLAGVT
jgi:hypothetical protein